MPELVGELVVKVERAACRPAGRTEIAIARPLL